MDRARRRVICSVREWELWGVGGGEWALCLIKMPALLRLFTLRWNRRRWRARILDSEALKRSHGLALELVRLPRLLLAICAAVPVSPAARAAACDVYESVCVSNRNPIDIAFRLVTVLSPLELKLLRLHLAAPAAVSVLASLEEQLRTSLPLDQVRHAVAVHSPVEVAEDVGVASVEAVSKGPFERAADGLGVGIDESFANIQGVAVRRDGVAPVRVVVDDRKSHSAREEQVGFCGERWGWCGVSSGTATAASEASREREVSVASLDVASDEKAIAASETNREEGDVRGVIGRRFAPRPGVSSSALPCRSIPSQLSPPHSSSASSTL